MATPQAAARIGARCRLVLSVMPKHAPDTGAAATRLDQCLCLYLWPKWLADLRRLQQALAYRGGVDLMNLIRLALQALEADPDYLERLRYAGRLSWKMKRKIAAACKKRSW